MSSTKMSAKTRLPASHKDFIELPAGDRFDTTYLFVDPKYGIVGLLSSLSIFKGWPDVYNEFISHIKLPSHSARKFYNRTGRTWNFEESNVSPRNFLLTKMMMVAFAKPPFVHQEHFDLAFASFSQPAAKFSPWLCSLNERLQSIPGLQKLIIRFLVQQLPDDPKAVSLLAEIEDARLDVVKSMLDSIQRCKETASNEQLDLAVAIKSFLSRFSEKDDKFAAFLDEKEHKRLLRAIIASFHSFTDIFGAPLDTWPAVIVTDCYETEMTREQLLEKLNFNADISFQFKEANNPTKVALGNWDMLAEAYNAFEEIPKPIWAEKE